MGDKWQELRRLVGSLKADDQEDWRLDIAHIFGGCSTDEDVALVEYLGKYIVPHRRVSEQAKDLLAERDELLAEVERLRAELVAMVYEAERAQLNELCKPMQGRRATGPDSDGGEED